MSIRFIEQIIFEIAMSLGNSLDMQEMLKTGLTTYLRKLNCMAGAVIMLNDSAGGGERCELIYSIPKKGGVNPAMTAALEMVNSQCRSTDFLQRLPLSKQLGESSFYIFSLPGFGLLVLVKGGAPFDRPMFLSLAPLNEKLARSCISCRQSEQLQQEMAIRKKAEEKYRSVFENAAHGLFQSTLGGILLTANPAMARILGYDSPQDLLQSVKSIREDLYVHPHDRDRFTTALRTDGQVKNFEGEFYCKDRTIIWGTLSAQLVMNEAGAPSHIEGICDDVTERVLAREALKNAKDEAEKLTRIKSNFLSMVSHELRTPLTSILGFSKMIRKRIADTIRPNVSEDKAVKMVQRIDENMGIIMAESQRLTELINNVLDLSKLESGRFEWIMVDVDLRNVINHSLAATEYLFRDKKIAIHRELDESLPPVTGDNDRLIQVCINLLSNASKFTPEGGEVSIHSSMRNGRALVRVEDTGIGVPPEEQETVFEIFKQVGDNLTDRPQGTGLGLSICKEIIELHGGDIWVESSSGKGSAFCFSLPLEEKH